MASNQTYVRWQKDEPRRGRTFAPLDPPHPAYEAPCVLCGYSLGSDRGPDAVTLVAVGPDADEQERHDAGRWYSALAVLVHTSCAAPLDEPALAVLAAELELRREAEVHEPG